MVVPVQENPDVLDGSGLIYLARGGGAKSDPYRSDLDVRAYPN
jgi:hypothetical protein